eukprot:TRINITY_DN7111_c0_g1_i1.p1 TRINITY_DN7111_c0_g1~~TRINITY_DN7111_c0_g1_i1.p1  ORF type:complete len:168 (+),score=65.59 TRINITY_DN7111_c0_g1_i1:30-506(+)
MPRKFMVAVDGSEHAKRAIELAKKLKREEDALVVLAVGAWEDQNTWVLDEKSVVDFKRAQLTKAEALVNAVMQELQDAGVSNVSGKAEIGSPRDVIVDEAQKENVTSLVLGSRGLGAFSRAFLGSVSEYAMKHAGCDVIVAKEKTRPPSTDSASSSSA